MHCNHWNCSPRRTPAAVRYTDRSCEQAPKLNSRHTAQSTKEMHKGAVLPARGFVFFVHPVLKCRQVILILLLKLTISNQIVRVL